MLVMRDSKIVHRESRTFDRRPPAAAWIRKREAELAKPAAVHSAHPDGFCFDVSC
jgi:hypothetical protein